MALLGELAQGDPAYALAAARRPRRRRAGLVVAVLLVLGLLLGVAAAGVRTDRGAGRSGLLAEVRERTAASDELAGSAAAARAEVAALRSAALMRGDAAAAARLAALELASAATAVTGPGIVVEIDDRPAGAQPGADPLEPRGGQVGSGRVLDRDLQDLVNGLWLAGAEAVSVNDLRLSARTAIRSAGEAVLVDLRPVSPPYVVRAIGDPVRLEPGFVDGATGRRLATYEQLYGLRLTVRSEPQMRLPAATVAQLRSAVPG